MYKRLLLYKVLHGTAMYHATILVTLGRWVSDQRSQLSDAHLDNERRQQVESLGFNWHV